MWPRPHHRYETLKRIIGFQTPALRDPFYPTKADAQASRKSSPGRDRFDALHGVSDRSSRDKVREVPEKSLQLLSPRFGLNGYRCEEITL